MRCPTCGAEFKPRTVAQTVCDLGCYLDRPGARKLIAQNRRGTRLKEYARPVARVEFAHA